jgi:hypothetical protein
MAHPHRTVVDTIVDSVGRTGSLRLSAPPAAGDRDRDGRDVAKQPPERRLGSLHLPGATRAQAPVCRGRWPRSYGRWPTSSDVGGVAASSGTWATALRSASTTGNSDGAAARFMVTQTFWVKLVHGALVVAVVDRHPPEPLGRGPANSRPSLNASATSEAATTTWCSRSARQCTRSTLVAVSRLSRSPGLQVHVGHAPGGDAVLEQPARAGARRWQEQLGGRARARSARSRAARWRPASSPPAGTRTGPWRPASGRPAPAGPMMS